MWSFYHVTACNAMHAIAMSQMSVRQTRELRQSDRNLCLHSSTFTWRKSATKFLCVNTVTVRDKVVRHSLAYPSVLVLPC